MWGCADTEFKQHGALDLMNTLVTTVRRDKTADLTAACQKTNLRFSQFHLHSEFQRLRLTRAPYWRSQLELASWRGGGVAAGVDQCSHPVNPACNIGECSHHGHTQQKGWESAHNTGTFKPLDGVKPSACRQEFSTGWRAALGLEGKCSCDR